MLLRGLTTTTHTHTHHRSICAPRLNNHYILSPQSLGFSITPYSLTHTGMQAHTHTAPTPTSINTSHLTWSCPQHVWGPHNSAVFTGTAGPSRQPGEQTVSMYTHLSRLPGEMIPTLPRGCTIWCSWPAKDMVWIPHWPHCLQSAANRQCGGGQCFKLCSEIMRIASRAPHCELCIQFFLRGGCWLKVSLLFFLSYVLKCQVIILIKGQELCKILYNHSMAQFTHAHNHWTQQWTHLRWK